MNKMRDILFRGKRVDTGEWVEGYFCKYPNQFKGYFCKNPNQFSGFLKPHIFVSSYDEEKETGSCTAYPIIQDTVQQFTELFDRNGKKIFEGDIVDILTENEERGVITYEDGGFVVKASTFVVDFMSNINGEDVEVLGNIVDNPELFEEE